VSRLDLHVHSRHSHDARGSVLELAEAARAHGLLGFALTDHDSIAGHAEIQDAMAQTGQIIVPSAEITTAEGHLLALGIRAAVPKGLGLKDTIDLVQAQGAIAVAAHPLRFWTGLGPRGLREHAELGHLHAAEARNARERQLAQQNTERLCRELGLALVGGSDAHWVRDIGTCSTQFDEPPVTVEDVLDGIRRGRCKPVAGVLPRRSIAAHQAQLIWRKLRRQ
jgi:predicted metal-dependent phosphoesterase TrpH